MQVHVRAVIPLKLGPKIDPIPIDKKLCVFPTNDVFNIENSQLHLHCDLKRLSQKQFSKAITCTNLR